MEFFGNFKVDYVAYERELFASGLVIEAEWNNSRGERRRVARTVSGAKKIMVYKRNAYGVYVIDYIGAFDPLTEVLDEAKDFRYMY